MAPPVELRAGTVGATGYAGVRTKSRHSPIAVNSAATLTFLSGFNDTEDFGV